MLRILSVMLVCCISVLHFGCPKNSVTLDKDQTVPFKEEDKKLGFIGNKDESGKVPKGNKQK